jgi:hypothetical protein
MRRLTLALGALLLTTSLFAAELPPGKWWRKPEIQQVLQITEDQQTRLEAIWMAAAADLIDLRGSVEKANISLRGELEQPQLNRQNIKASANRLSDARARLFERELMMLVDMRAIMSDAQWMRMRQILDRLENQRQNQNRPQGDQKLMRPNMRPNRR